MEFRYQETLTWIIPGFYLLFGGLAIIVCFHIFKLSDYQSSLSIIGDNGLAAILIFLIPILSIIVGWVINGLSGLLFRLDCLFGYPVYKAYNKIYPEKVGVSNAEKMHAFDKAKYELEDLGSYDRFYYRYIFSRNMFVAQIFQLLFAICLCTFCSSDIKCKYLLTIISVLIILCVIFYAILYRDLNTHSRYIFNGARKIKTKGILSKLMRFFHK